MSALTSKLPFPLAARTAPRTSAPRTERFGLVAWWRNRQAVRALMALDDARLSDLGLGRGDIEQAVWSGRASPRRV